MDTRYKHDWGTSTCLVTPLAANLLLRAAWHFIHGHSHVRPGPGLGRAVCQAVVGLWGLPGLTKVSKVSTLSAAQPPANTARQRAVGVRVLRLRNRALQSCAPTPLSTRSQRDRTSLRGLGLLGSLPALQRPLLGL